MGRSVLPGLTDNCCSRPSASLAPALPAGPNIPPGIPLNIGTSDGYVRCAGCHPGSWQACSQVPTCCETQLRWSHKLTRAPADTSLQKRSPDQLRVRGQRQRHHAAREVPCLPCQRCRQHGGPHQAGRDGAAAERADRHGEPAAKQHRAQACSHGAHNYMSQRKLNPDLPAAPAPSAAVVPARPSPGRYGVHQAQAPPLATAITAGARGSLPGRHHLCQRDADR
jgi:hypothetical protein